MVDDDFFCVVNNEMSVDASDPSSMNICLKNRSGGRFPNMFKLLILLIRTPSVGNSHECLFLNNCRTFSLAIFTMF